MKKILSVLALFVAITVTAQKSAAPAAAKAAFAKAYPAASKVKWEKEDGNYEVTFFDKGNELSAIYNAKGIMQESEHEMKVTELPATISAYMKEHYKGVKVTGAAKITKTDGSVNYEAAVKGKDVLFDVNGKFIKEVKEVKEKD
ncbi:MAG: PepSY-like domain-containing protein [Sediminibacterium sp.]